MALGGLGFHLLFSPGQKGDMFSWLFLFEDETGDIGYIRGRQPGRRIHLQKVPRN